MQVGIESELGQEQRPRRSTWQGTAGGITSRNEDSTTLQNIIAFIHTSIYPPSPFPQPTHNASPNTSSPPTKHQAERTLIVNAFKATHVQVRVSISLLASMPVQIHPEASHSLNPQNAKRHRPMLMQIRKKYSHANGVKPPC